MEKGKLYLKEFLFLFNKASCELIIHLKTFFKNNKFMSILLLIMLFITFSMPYLTAQEFLENEGTDAVKVGREPLNTGEDAGEISKDVEILEGDRDVINNGESDEEGAETKSLLFLNSIQKSFFYGKRDPKDNTLNIFYVPGEVPMIRLRYAMNTMFIFDNDPIVFASLGDESGFELIRPIPSKDNISLDKVLLVRPKLIGVDTNLSVVGESGKLYNFYIFSTHITNRRNPTLNVFISDKRKIGRIEVDKEKIENLKEKEEREEKISLLNQEVQKLEKNKNSNEINILDRKNTDKRKERLLKKEIEKLKANPKAVDYIAKIYDDGEFITIGDNTNKMYIEKDQIKRSYYQAPKVTVHTEAQNWILFWREPKSTKVVSKGALAIQSRDIFDDGKYTYFKYDRDKSLSKFPIPYKVVDGYDVPVNSRVVGDYIIAEDVSENWTLRLGDEYVCVAYINHNEIKEGINNSIKEVVNNSKS